MIKWILSHKLLLCFCAATLAFGIATIVLAVEKSDLQTDLDTCNDKVVPLPTDGPPSTTDPPTTTTTSTTTGSTTTTTTAAPPPDLSGYRLPRNVIPSAYDLTLIPDLETGLFRGIVAITVTVSEAAQEIRLHSKGLTVTSAQLDGIDMVIDMSLNEQFELLVIRTVQNVPIPPAVYTVTINYNGDMKDRIVGLYMSTYPVQGDPPHTIVTSKFEPTYARQAYPCFDEPNMKVMYTVHIVKPNTPTYIALSNLPSTSEEAYPETGGTVVHFAESIPMSTYLSCFIVCDFEFTPGTITAPGTPNVDLRVFATPAQISKTLFARDVAQDVMTYFIEYFGIPFPLPKLDLIAIPDFVSGAMEHWGLVTFRETALLYDPATSSSANQQRVAEVVAHELAHSWFGNLVTMDWWNDLWLNEGFATYIESKGLNEVYPEWQKLDQFLIADLHPVLSLDATTASHPIVQTVLTPDQITAIFDTITYSKGASILRMLEETVGEAVFRQGVTNYLNAHRGANAVTQDLWDELEALAADIDVTQFMDTWTRQKGYPILTVYDDDSRYILLQQRFLKDPDSADDELSPFGFNWDIPIRYVTDLDGPSQITWCYYYDIGVQIPKPVGATWIKFNPGQVGYYRVNYPVAMWQTLAQNIDTMPIADKTHLLEESFSIAESGLLSYQIPLDLTQYLTDERNYVPWSVAATKLEQLKRYLLGSLEYPNYMKYVVDLVTPAYDELTWTENQADEHLTKRARITILNLACSMGHAGCLQEAQTRFQAWIADPVANPVSQDLRTIIYNYGMSASGEEQWNEVYERFLAETDANEKLNLMRSLTTVKDTWLLRRFLELGWDEAVVRRQDYFTFLQYISVNPAGTAMVWDYVREHWLDLVDRFTLNERNLGRLIPAVTSSFTTATKTREMEGFFEDNPEAGAGEAARVEALQNVNNNIKWLQTNLQDVEQWIRDYTAPSP